MSQMGSDSARSTFWFLVAFGGAMQVMVFFAPDSFRKERSVAWRRAMKRAQARAIVDETARHEAEAAAAAEAALSPIEGKNEPAPSEKPDELPVIKPAVSFKAGAIVVEGSDGQQSIPVKLAFSDVNPLSALGSVVRSPQVFLITSFSGILCASVQVADESDSLRRLDLLNR